MNNESFIKWVQATLAELEAPRPGGGLMTAAHADHIAILRRALRHEDELQYDLDMARMSNDLSRCEMIEWEIRERDRRAAL